MPPPVRDARRLPCTGAWVRIPIHRHHTLPPVHPTVPSLQHFGNAFIVVIIIVVVVIVTVAITTMTAMALNFTNLSLNTNIVGANKLQDSTV